MSERQNLDTEDFSLIIIKQPTQFDIELKGYTLSFQETKINFIKNLTDIHSSDLSLIKDTDLEARNASFFKELAYESGKKSRFLLDSRFGEEKFKQLYDIWIINSLNKKFAQKTYYIEADEKAIGFVTLQQHEKLGKIGLIATHPDFQGKGFGKKLLYHTENFCIENGITQLEIPTQKENIQACAFYKKQGYDIKDEVIIKHYWKNDSL